MATGERRETLIAWPERALADSFASAYQMLIQRRLAGEPIAYIMGRRAFWNVELRVTPDTLVPRPETELLVEIALESLAANEELTVVDAGTGTGAIAISLALERPNWHLLASERAAGACQVARENIDTLAHGRVGLIQADWLEPLRPASIDAVITNPPYIAAGDPYLERGDLRAEPRDALVAGNDGLAAIRVLVPTAWERLRPGGLIALEHGFDQAEAVRGILAASGYLAIETRDDLAGHARVTLGHKSKTVPAPIARP